MKKHWVLIYNHLDKKPYPRENIPENCTIPFKLYDGDDVLYFTGLMSEKLYESGEAIFEPLDYAMASWGCTDLKVNGPRDNCFTLV